jgi:hypothetical protein
LTNERTGEKHDWSKHEQDVIEWQIILPKITPGELTMRAEQAEKRWDGRVGRWQLPKNVDSGWQCRNSELANSAPGGTATLRQQFFADAGIGITLIWSHVAVIEREQARSGPRDRNSSPAGDIHLCDYSLETPCYEELLPMSHY